MSLARLLPPVHRYVQLSAPGALDLAVNGGTEGISELGTTNLRPREGQDLVLVRQQKGLTRGFIAPGQRQRHGRREELQRWIP